MHHQVYLRWLLCLRSRFNVGSSSLPSRFSTLASLNQSSNAHGPHVPCDLTNASTFTTSSCAELGTLGVASFVELQGTLGALSSAKLQGALGVANFASLCSFSCRGV